MSASSSDLSRRNVMLGGLGIAGMTALAPRFASAQGRAETLLVVQELGPNSLDMQGVGSNQTERAVLELLRPPAELRLQDAPRRHAVL